MWFSHQQITTKENLIMEIFTGIVKFFPVQNSWSISKIFKTKFDLKNRKIIFHQLNLFDGFLSDGCIYNGRMTTSHCLSFSIHSLFLSLQVLLFCCLPLLSILVKNSRLILFVTKSSTLNNLILFLIIMLSFYNEIYC